MARFSYTTVYAGTYVAGTFTVSSVATSVNKIVTDGNPPRIGDFDINEPLETIGGGIPNSGNYLAHTADGSGIIVHVNANPLADPPVVAGDYLLTNANYSSGDVITTLAEIFTTCFLTDTMIATPAGERPVETLEIGDIILTADGSTRAIRWIGRQSVVSIFASPLRSYPIRIVAGGLGDGLPKRDLFLSPDHALLVDEILVQAGALVNNTSITRVMQPDERFTYYHIETEDHALILAEGVLAETFVDNVTRRTFDNYAEYEALYGEETVVPELDLPRAMSARQVPRTTRERLAAIATTLRFGTGIAA